MIKEKATFAVLSFDRALFLSLSVPSILHKRPEQYKNNHINLEFAMPTFAKGRIVKCHEITYTLVVFVCYTHIHLTVALCECVSNRQNDFDVLKSLNMYVWHKCAYRS